MIQLTESIHVPNSYRFGVLSYKIIGVICVLFFAGCAVGAFSARQYPPIAIFAFFGLMGIFMIVSAGNFEISEKFVTHRNIFGSFRMAWIDVKKIEFGPQGSIVLHGENMRFVLPPPTFWSGQQKPEAFDLFRRTIEQLGVVSYPSNTADYKTHKNVRIRAEDLA